MVALKVSIGERGHCGDIDRVKPFPVSSRSGSPVSYYVTMNRRQMENVHPPFIYLHQSKASSATV